MIIVPSHLFNLAQHSPVHTAKTMQNELKRIQKRFCELSKAVLNSQGCAEISILPLRVKKTINPKHSDVFLFSF